MGRRTAPARSREQRELQLIGLAMDNAQRMLEEGNAPSQIVSHFLKLGAEKTRYEIEKLKADRALTEAKIESIKLQQRTDEVYEEALNAFRDYGGDSYHDD